jgi:hypothetical protein
MADLATLIERGLADFQTQVRAGTYPDAADAPHFTAGEYAAFLKKFKKPRSVARRGSDREGRK